MTAGTRVQVALGGRLQMEAVVDNGWEASLLYSRWACLKERRGLPWGGSVVTRADLPRTWNVPVGAEIVRCELCEGSVNVEAHEPVRTCQNAFWSEPACGTCRRKNECPECQRTLVRDAGVLTCPRQVDNDDRRD